MSSSKNSRRNFIQTSAKAGVALSLASLPASSLLADAAVKHASPGSAGFFTSFDQAPLGYAYNVLEPYIDALTMDIHYNKHAATYAKNLKEAAAAEGVDMAKPLEDVLVKISKYSPKMRNNGGGHYNHEMFWKSMKPGGEGIPSGKLLTAIVSSFNSFESFKTQFGDAGKNRFGSGWAWLVVDGDKKLKIGSTPNQDNPIMDVSDFKGIPLLGLDVWEHAYYLKYQNRRPDYITAWWSVVNWDAVQKRFEAIA